MTADALYPQVEPYCTFRLDTDAPHSLYVEESGIPDGIPVVVLHGGPGAGSRPSQRRSFDPARFRIILFDQRGCGKSTPSAELSGNDTAALVADIDRIRAHLGIEKWLVAGGSWGSLLALAYAISHTDRCLGLRLNGVFLGTPEEIRFWFHDTGAFFPDAFADFAAAVPESERGDLLRACYTRLIDPDPAVHAPVARELRGFSARSQTLLPSAAHVNALTEAKTALEISRIFTHYCVNGFFLAPGQILSNVGKLRHLPCEIVQGRYDTVTPMRTAWALHQAWPQARFTVVDLANHIATPEAPALSVALRAAADRLADSCADMDAGPPIETFLAPRAHHSAALSEDGRILAWLSDETGFDQLWTRDLATGAAPVLRTSLDEPVGAFAFRPKSHDILFTTDCGGDERHQLHLLSEGTTLARNLTGNPQAVHQWGAFDAEGQRIAYASNAADATAMRIHVMDLASGRSRVVADGPGWRAPMSFSPDGAHLLVQDNRDGMFDASLHLVDLKTGAERLVLEGKNNAHINAARWVGAGTRLVLATDWGTAFHGVAAIDIATGAFDWLAQPEGDVELLVVSKDGARIAYAVNEAGYTRLILRDLGSGAERTLALPFAGRSSALSFTPDHLGLLVAHEGFARPSAVLRIDLSSGAATFLAEGAAVLTQEDTVEPSLIAVASFDGAQVPAFVFEPRRPAPASGRPALVIVHGGPESQYAAHWRPDVQYLVRRGWTVVAPNVRGSTGYGKAWQAGDDLEKRMDSVRDLKAVRDWLAARPDIDADRLVVSGQSYGGFMVLAAITEYPQDWRAAVNFYGIADFNTLMATTGPWRRRLRSVEYGDPDTAEGRDMLHRFSPMRKLGAVRVPVFIAHGGDDPRVPPGESEMVYSALRGRGHPCELVRIDHAGHGFVRLGDRETVFGAMMRFVEGHSRPRQKE